VVLSAGNTAAPKAPVRNFERIVQILTELDRDDRPAADQKP
jgi:hypothetical protein